MNKNKAKELDKYYTNNDVAKYCYDIFKQFCSEHISTEYLTIEPSAGGGAFYNAIEGSKLGFDLLPECDGVHEMNFITGDLGAYIGDDPVVFLGNPPFGKKGDLAIEFINKCFLYGNIVGFILPVQFRKYSAQKRIDSRARLVMDIDLDAESFNIVGESYSIRSSFQIWTLGIDLPDLRQRDKPQTSTELFNLYQYNRTDEALKYFDYEWDFAVHRQGFYDYNTFYYNKDDMDRKRQYVFIKASTDEILENLKKIDFEALSKKNAGTPGFGKADIIQEYKRLFGDRYD